MRAYQFTLRRAVDRFSLLREMYVDKLFTQAKEYESVS